MRKIAIIGASYLQVPLIRRAQELGLETHVFAWQAGDPGEAMADVFYPISIVEKEKILEACRGIGIQGVATIASDLAVVTVNYVAERMGLVGNCAESTLRSTNKHFMRLAFAEHGDPSPKSIRISDVSELRSEELQFPVIVKPTDRSGSRGITKLASQAGLEEAVAAAAAAGFDKHVLIETFAEGQEYSVECLSFRGRHHFLAMTKKYTTGAPHFVETGHMQPAPLAEEKVREACAIVFHALDSLLIENGASHAELKIDAEGKIRLIEIGGRMGGDFIGSDLVRLTTGIDFVGNVIRIAMGEAPDLSAGAHSRYGAVRFLLTEADEAALARAEQAQPGIIRRREAGKAAGIVMDSSERFGYFLMASDDWTRIAPYMPDEASV